MKRIGAPQFFGTKGADIFPRNFNTNPVQRKFNPALMPSPVEYYAAQLAGLKVKQGWAKVLCCFHEENQPSLSINLIEGHFRCFACNAKGGDVLAFHRLRYKLSFVEAVNHFGAWSHD